MIRLMSILTLWLSAAAFTALGSEPVKIRVLSYNIRHGEGTDHKIDLERIAKVIKSVDPDVVALQEVDRNTKRSKMVDQPKELARLTGMHSIFEKNIPFQGGEYGNAILTKTAPKSHRNHPLPSQYKGEQRGALEVELAQPDSFLFVSTHLDYRPSDKERQLSIELFEKLYAKSELPVLIAGDFNSVEESDVIKNLRTNNWLVPEGKGKWFTFPSEKPARQIDYIIARPLNRWRVEEVKVLDEPLASDHRPFLTVFTLSPVKK
jgi:endonuclease/exonuclease/phosphatase family metal-dependent hydrolase